MLFQERSKPVQPPSKPEIAPFFLPTMESLSRNPVFNTNGATEQSTENPNLPDQNLPGWGDEADTTNANGETWYNLSKASLPEILLTKAPSLHSLIYLRWILDQYIANGKQTTRGCQQFIRVSSWFKSKRILLQISDCVHSVIHTFLSLDPGPKPKGFLPQLSSINASNLSIEAIKLKKIDAQMSPSF